MKQSVYSKSYIPQAVLCASQSIINRRQIRQSVIRNLQSAILVLCLLCSPAAANNIRVANVVLQGQDTNARIVKVAFDLAWDNSWRGDENWDAAWVFVKFRAPGSNDWEHAALGANAADHFAPAGSTIAVGLSGGLGDWGTTGLGVFVYSSANRTGNVNYAAVKLLWHYGSNDCDFVKGDRVEVSVHALEMVYIPEGAFYLGSGGSELSHFYKYPTSTDTFLVTNESDAIVVGTNSGNLYYAYSANSGDQLGPISNAFPKGYAAFYCMKYEVSQGQYADFLNKLTAAQDATRYPNAIGNSRHTIGGTPANRVASRPDRACNFLTWAHGSAYADWAALRPMTELEFEKACRGPADPVANEYVWGTTTIMPAASGLSGAEDGTETVTNSAALGGCNYQEQMHIGGDGGVGPLRCGIYATNNATRIPSGAGYYGAMELAGNLGERPVTVGSPEGRSFQGTHGDGVLAADGNATGNTDWPGTSGLGAGDRGCGRLLEISAMLLSYRGYAAVPRGETQYYGWRAVRSAP